MLRQIPDCFALLPDVAAHGTVPTAPGAKHPRHPDPPAPYRLAVRDLLDSSRITQNHGDPDHPPIVSDNRRGVLGLVHSWAQAVRHERRLPPVSSVTVARECAFLGSHLPWVTEQHWIGDMYNELKPLVRQLTDAVGDYRAKPVGMCVALVPKVELSGRFICGGPLYRDQVGHGVHCGLCSARTDPERLREIGRSVGLIADEDDGSASQEVS